MKESRLKQSLGAMIDLIVVGGLCLLYSLLVLLIPAALSFPWMFAYLSRFQNSFGGSLKFVLFLTARHLGRSLLLAGELLLFLAISWLIPQLLPLLPGPFALLASLSVEPVFREYTQDQTPPDGDAWYNE